MKQSSKLIILGSVCYFTPGLVGLLFVFYFPDALSDEFTFVLPLIGGVGIPFIFLPLFGLKIVKEIEK